MMRAGLALAALTLAIVAGPAVAAPDAPGTGRLAPCTNDDVDGNAPACVWDAQHTGNGTGGSFVWTPSGKLIPVPHYVAHALVFGGTR